MYGITTNLFTRSAPPSATSVDAFSNNKSGSGFQPTAGLERLPSPAAALVLRSAGLSAATSSLGAQTVSTLLQTQEVGQTPIHGGHGGGHHGGPITPGIETQEAEESEEAQMLSRRKKLLKDMQADKVAENAETDESDETSSDDVERKDGEKRDQRAG